MFFWLPVTFIFQQQLLPLTAKTGKQIADENLVIKIFTSNFQLLKYIKKFIYYSMYCLRGLLENLLQIYSEFLSEY